MNKDKEIYGVDISKDVFDVFSVRLGHKQFKNDEKGFTVFLKLLEKGSLVVMEATGYYHYRLAQYLYKQGAGIGSESIICKTFYPDETG